MVKTYYKCDGSVYIGDEKICTIEPHENDKKTLDFIVEALNIYNETGPTPGKFNERSKALEDAARLVEGYAESWASQPKKGFFAEELYKIAKEIRNDPAIRIEAAISEKPRIKPLDSMTELLADAVRVYHETGLTPRELKEQRDGLLETISDIEALADRETQIKSGAKVDTKELLPDILKLARMALEKVEGRS